MSSARRRGQARGQDPTNQPRRGPNPARGRVAPFDGPASRGSASGAGSQSQVSGPAPSSRRGSNAGSQAGSQAPSAAPSQPAARTTGLDPAREGPVARVTDVIRFVDMPASFYNINHEVSLHLHSIYASTNIS